MFHVKHKIGKNRRKTGGGVGSELQEKLVSGREKGGLEPGGRERKKTRPWRRADKVCRRQPEGRGFFVSRTVSPVTRFSFNVGMPKKPVNVRSPKKFVRQTFDAQKIFFPRLLREPCDRSRELSDL